MKYFQFLLWAIVFSLSGCVTPGMKISDILPLATPTIDQPLHSVNYYKSVYNVDLYAKPHDMNDELRSAQEATATCNKVYSKISIMGKTPKCAEHYEIYTKSKKIGNNDYILACPAVPAAEKQNGDGACWAASSQFIIAVRYNKHIDQAVLIQKIKGTESKTFKDQAGSVVESIRALGVVGLSIYPNGSYELLESLGRGVPVMVGLYNTETQTGHVVVIVAARFSFTSRALPLCLSCGTFAFAEFMVYDPAAGDIVKKDAAEIERDISFLIAFS